MVEKRRKRNIEEIREELIELSISDDSKWTNPEAHANIALSPEEEREFVRVGLNHIIKADEDWFYREAEKEGIDIYEPEPKKTKRKGVRLI